MLGRLPILADCRRERASIHRCTGSLPRHGSPHPTCRAASGMRRRQAVRCGMRSEAEWLVTPTHTQTNMGRTISKSLSLSYAVQKGYSQFDGERKGAISRLPPTPYSKSKAAPSTILQFCEVNSKSYFNLFHRAI